MGLYGPSSIDRNRGVVTRFAPCSDIGGHSGGIRFAFATARMARPNGGTTMNQSTDVNSMMAIAQDHMRSSLNRARAQAEGRLRALSRLIKTKPVRSLGMAFVSGVVIARLLQKLG